jgi:hypothetical protein
MKIKNFLFLFLICLSAAAIAQPMPPPSPVCIAMNADGSQGTLSWITPTLNGNVFDNYQIFHSTNQAGPYNLVATVPVYLQTSEVVNLTPSGGPEYFYLTSNLTEVRYLLIPISFPLLSPNYQYGKRNPSCYLEPNCQSGFSLYCCYLPSLS